LGFDLLNRWLLEVNRIIFTFFRSEKLHFSEERTSTFEGLFVSNMVRVWLSENLADKVQLVVPWLFKTNEAFLELKLDDVNQVVLLSCI
jgi:hypothetical protein